MVEGMRDRDFEKFASALASDVVLHSPITGAYRVEGRDQVVELVQLVRGSLEDFRPIPGFGDDQIRAVRFEARVQGRPIEGLDILTFDAAGLVREIRVFMRPLPGLTDLMASLAGPIARRAGVPSIAITPPIRLQRRLALIGDRAGVRLLRRAFSRAS